MSQSTPGTGDSRWSRLLQSIRGLGADAEDMDAKDLRGDVGHAGATAVAGCSRGQRATIAGRLRSVVTAAARTAPSVEAELFDGTGSVRLIWLGQRRIPGIEPGRSLVASGRLAQQDGEFVIYNPWYELKPPGS